MKYIILVPDGAADYPLKELDGKTPLQVAHIPYMNKLAQKGLIGTVKTVPEGMSPGSDVANLSIMGYDPNRFYTGRGPLEAASKHIPLGANEVAFRCNLITVTEHTLDDYSAGHITTKEACELMEVVNAKLGNNRIRFYTGVSYRHLMVMQDELTEVECIPPHDVVGANLEEIWPKGKGAEELIELMKSSRKILEIHPVNQNRVKNGKKPANMIWLWGQGKAPAMPTFKEKYGLTGKVISAVDLVKGIGLLAGLQVLEVPGATGYFDTDYRAKAQYGLKALEEVDLVFIHVEAPDEAGHLGDLRAKIKALENFDSLIVKAFLEELSGDFKILLLPDHATPIEVKTHVNDPVPFAIYESNSSQSRDFIFDEFSAKKSSIYFSEGYKLMDFFVGRPITKS